MEKESNKEAKEFPIEKIDKIISQDNSNIFFDNLSYIFKDMDSKILASKANVTTTTINNIKNVNKSVSIHSIIKVLESVGLKLVITEDDRNIIGISTSERLKKFIKNDEGNKNTFNFNIGMEDRMCDFLVNGIRKILLDNNNDILAVGIYDIFNKNKFVMAFYNDNNEFKISFTISKIPKRIKSKMVTLDNDTVFSELSDIGISEYGIRFIKDSIDDFCPENNDLAKSICEEAKVKSSINVLASILFRRICEFIRIKCKAFPHVSITINNNCRIVGIKENKVCKIFALTSL